MREMMKTIFSRSSRPRPPRRVVSRRATKRCQKIIRSVMVDDTRWKNWVDRIVSNHVATCPRCRTKLMDLGRVSLGISLLRAQRQPSDLLGDANKMALQKMRRSVRCTPEAQVLRVARPHVSPWIRVADISRHVMHSAACFLVLLVLRSAITDQIQQTVDLGEKLAAHHEAAHIYGRDSDWT